MNRETILACITRNLREHRGGSTSAHLAQSCSLVSIVQRVAAEVRSEPLQATTVAKIVPLPIVAAFVDGDLSPDESATVVQAIMTDNGVLAEVIAAMRAKSEWTETTTPLSSHFADRLNAMVPAVNTSADVPKTTLPTIEASVRPSVSSRQSVATWRRSRKWALIAITLATTAAVVLVILQWRARVQPDPLGRESAATELAVTPASPSQAPPKRPSERSRIFEPQTEPSAQSIVEKEKSFETGGGALENPTESPNPIDNSMAPRIVIDSAPDIPNMAPTKDPRPETVPSIVPAGRDLKWKRTSGLVTQQVPLENDRDYSRGEVWRNATTDVTELGSADQPASLILYSLPFSRGEAELGSGGRIILGGDTSIQLATGEESVSIAVDVRHGNLALLDFPIGSIVAVRAGGQKRSRLKFQTNGSVVIRSDSTGIETAIHSGTVEIIEGAQPVQMKRLPTWVDRPVDTISVPRTILAQIGQAPDVWKELNRQALALAKLPGARTPTESRTLTTLSLWQAALAGRNFPRLLNVERPELRTAAIARLVRMPIKDPRYETTWSSIAQVIQSPRQLAVLQQFSQQLQMGVPIDGAGINLLLTSLETPTVGQRAISDYLLRMNYNGGPLFDPTWTGAQQQRGVALWRTTIGRTNAGRGAGN